MRAEPGSARHALDALIDHLDRRSPQPAEGAHFRRPATALRPGGPNCATAGATAGAVHPLLQPEVDTEPAHPRHPRQHGRAHRRPGRRLAPATAAAASAAALVTALGVPRAYAYFSSSGLGSGSTAVGTGQVGDVSVTGVSGVADLVPGGTGAVSFAIHNPNDQTMTYDQLAGASVISSSSDECPSTVLNPVPPAFPWTLPQPLVVGARSSTGPDSIPALVRLSADAPSSCQGVTFRIRLTLTGELRHPATTP